jgi:hypothetical protein
MEYKIIETNDKNKKTEYTNNILRKLPEWFGIEKSLKKYVNTVNKIHIGQHLIKKITV